MTDWPLIASWPDFEARANVYHACADTNAIYPVWSHDWKASSLHHYRSFLLSHENSLDTMFSPLFLWWLHFSFENQPLSLIVNEKGRLDVCDVVVCGGEVGTRLELLMFFTGLLWFKARAEEESNHKDRGTKKICIFVETERFSTLTKILGIEMSTKQQQYRSMVVVVVSVILMVLGFYAIICFVCKYGQSSRWKDILLSIKRNCNIFYIARIWVIIAPSVDGSQSVKKRRPGKSWLMRILYIDSNEREIFFSKSVGTLQYAASRFKMPGRVHQFFQVMNGAICILQGTVSDGIPVSLSPSATSLLLFLTIRIVVTFSNDVTLGASFFHFGFWCCALLVSVLVSAMRKRCVRQIGWGGVNGMWVIGIFTVGSVAKVDWLQLDWTGWHYPQLWEHNIQQRMTHDIILLCQGWFSKQVNS